MNLLAPFYWSFGVNVTYFALEVLPRNDDCVLVCGEPAEVMPEGKLVKMPKAKNVQFHVYFVSVPMYMM
jgi:hypothetical protein